MFLEIKRYNKINNDLAIMQQNSSFWYAQIKSPPEHGIPNNRKRISTGFKIGTVDNFLNAVAFGKRLLDKQSYLSEVGMSLPEITPSVKTVGRKTVKKINDQKIKRGTHKEYIRVLEKEIIPTLGDIRFNQLGTLKIKNYFTSINCKSKTSVTIPLWQNSCHC